MRSFDERQHLFIHLGRRFRGAHQLGIAPQILVVHRLQRHHIKFLAHAKTRYHGTCQFCGLFNVVGSAAGNFAKHHFLRYSASCISDDTVHCLLLGHQHIFSFLYLHGVAQCARGTGHDCDLMYRCCFFSGLPIRAHAQFHA